MRALYLIVILSILVATGCKKEEDCPQQKNSSEEQLTLTSIDTLVTLSYFFPAISCNGHPELCGKRFDEVVFALTHNSQASNDEFSFFAANQDGNVSQQLAAGIRGLGIKAYWEANASCGDGSQGMYMYHGDPIFGCIKMEDYLSDVKSFLVSNPTEIILMTIEGGASTERLDSMYSYAGLGDFQYDHTWGENWPTMIEMIESNKRLVVLSDNGDAEDFEGFHGLWNYTVDVNYDIQDPANFDCDYARGNPDGYFYQMNHFVTIITPQQNSAQTINQYEYLYNRAVDCMTQNSRKPNFIMLDFYATGDVVQVVDSLNLNF
ncbi:MAG: hypothetical protein ACI9UR_001753 [Bacteroidia bacterium]|jgi:hypothetical protein